MTDQYRDEKDALYEFEVRNLDRSRANPAIFREPYKPTDGPWMRVVEEQLAIGDHHLKMAALAYVDHPDFMLNKQPWETVIAHGTIEDCKRMFSYLVDFQISAHGMELKCR